MFFFLIIDFITLLYPILLVNPCRILYYLIYNFSGNMEHWPALNKWKDLNYLVKLAGARLVPVEIGSSYADADWSQKLITLEEFINIHVVQESEKPTYLAQHQLFNQVN